MDSSSWSSSSLKSTLSFALSSCFLSSSISFAALIVWGKYFIRQHGWEFCSSLIFIFLYLLAVFHNSINMLWTLYSLQCIYIDPDMDNWIWCTTCSPVGEGRRSPRSGVPFEHPLHSSVRRCADLHLWKYSLHHNQNKTRNQPVEIQNRVEGLRVPGIRFN